jgi:aldehyde:ferredoxin oxidoreductase
VLGKILKVDLTSDRSEFKKADEKFFKKYLGGAGLNAKLIYDEMTSNNDEVEIREGSSVWPKSINSNYIQLHTFSRR